MSKIMSPDEYYEKLRMHGADHYQASRLTQEYVRSMDQRYYQQALSSGSNLMVGVGMAYGVASYDTAYGTISTQLSASTLKCKSCGKDQHKGKVDYRGRCENTVKKVWEKRQKLFRHRDMKNLTTK